MRGNFEVAKPPLENRIENLKDKNYITKNLKSHLDKINFNQSSFIKTGIKLKHLKSTKKLTIQEISKTRYQIGVTFLKHKKKLHEKTDPRILDPLSDIFDVRLWNINEVHLIKSKNNEQNEKFVAEFKKRFFAVISQNLSFLLV